MAHEAVGCENAESAVERILAVLTAIVVRTVTGVVAAVMKTDEGLEVAVAVRLADTSGKRGR